jgi:two-component system KDP operon response regulator KdpE
MTKKNPMQGRFRILVVDDEPETLKMLRIMLTSEGFEVLAAQGAIEGLRMAYQAHPDAILLDVMMPEVDGFEVCQRLREMTDVPIIFVTAKGTIEDIVRGFSLGADDYIVKPFDSSELISRLIASLRRAGERADESVEVLFPAGSVVLDCGRHELLIGTRNVYLTPKEFEVLRLLVRHTGKVLSADAILTQVWGPERVGEPDLVKQYIYKLRQKIENDPASPRYLHTVRGGGYYFDADDLIQ